MAGRRPARAGSRGAEGERKPSLVSRIAQAAAQVLKGDAAFQATSRRETAPPDGIPRQFSTQLRILSSQGLAVAPDLSAAYYHGSTSPANYYKTAYDMEDGMNMDRGGFGQSRDGTNFGCVFDGVTAGGKINAMAAQAFADFTMGWLAEHHSKFKHGQGCNEGLAKEVLTKATDKSNNPASLDQQFNGEGGSATGAFVTVEATGRGLAIVNGAAVGDAAVVVIHRDEGRARLLNCVQRRGRKDTGGQLTLAIGIDGEIWSFSEPVSQSAILLLATDGLTDNLNDAELPNTIPLIVCCQAFDAPPPDDCPFVKGADAHLPSLAELQQLFGDALDDLADISCVAVVHRLTNYVKWVTRSLHRDEQEYYAQLKALEQSTAVALASGRVPKEDAAVRACQTRMDALTKQRAEGTAGKTDDAMVIAMLPFHARG